MFSRPGDLNSENSQGLGQEHAWASANMNCISKSFAFSISWNQTLWGEFAIKGKSWFRTDSDGGLPITARVHCQNPGCGAHSQVILTMKLGGAWEPVCLTYPWMWLILPVEGAQPKHWLAESWCSNTVAWIWKVPHRFIGLNAWSPAGGLFEMLVELLGGGPLLV